MSWRKTLLDEQARDEYGESSGKLWPRNIKSQDPDCIIIVGNTQFKSYKVLLSHFSPVFDAMFCSAMKEGRDGIINLIGRDPDEWEYVYSFCNICLPIQVHMRRITVDNAMMLIPWFDFLGLDHFIARCDTILATKFIDQSIGLMKQHEKKQHSANEVNKNVKFTYDMFPMYDGKGPKVIKNPTLWVNLEDTTDRSKRFEMLVKLGNLLSLYTCLPKSKKTLTLAIGDLMRLDFAVSRGSGDGDLGSHTRNHSTLDLFLSMDVLQAFVHLVYPLYQYKHGTINKLHVKGIYNPSVKLEEQESFHQEYLFDVLKYLIYQNDIAFAMWSELSKSRITINSSTQKPSNDFHAMTFQALQTYIMTPKTLRERSFLLRTLFSVTRVYTDVN